MMTTQPVRTCATLDEVRAEIDRIDGALIALLAERAAYVRQAAGFKRTEAEARAPARVEQVITRTRARAEAAGLSPDVAERTWRAMIAAFIDDELAILATRVGNETGDGAAPARPESHPTRRNR